MSELKMFVVVFLIGLIVDGTSGNTRYLTKTANNASDLFKTKNNYLRISHEPIAVTKSPLLHETNSRFGDGAPTIHGKSKFERRNFFVETSTFNPDVLNRFLEEYATKMKSTTDKTYKNPFTVLDRPVEPFQLEIQDQINEESKFNKDRNASNRLTTTTTVHKNDGTLKLDRPSGNDNANDTLERNKHGGSSPYDDRNGWVTLEAIPWSKSKISKWQANQDPQKPLPEHKPWENPLNVEKPWPERPSYEENVPWYEKPKPYYPENSNNQKPWYESERPKPSKPSRPSYFDDNEFDERPSYAQKWPPEKPWDKFSNSNPHKEAADIITDDKPANFPGNWERPQISKPSHNIDRFSENNRDQMKNDWKTHSYNFPSKYEELNNRPSNFGKPSSSFDRPHFSHYQYSTDHPTSHPANGDGQWILLSTNRGYSKSRQRSIKIDSANGGQQQTDSKPKNGENDGGVRVPVMSSRRQVRLTVLPSVNGTNTTTSHGGLLEVEKTFKTVDQSQREYEREKLSGAPSSVSKRPPRNPGNQQPSNSAVLAAVGAGMLPATMAMVIPMMLGRKRRSSTSDDLENTLKKSSILELNDDLVNNLNQRRRLRKLRM